VMGTTSGEAPADSAMPVLGTAAAA
jgi:hypothetical protein